MSTAHRDPARDPWLDALRAGAAGLVLLSHARSMLIRDAADQPGLPLLGKVFFALSGLGHAAVIVFFVLSGLLVTGAMLRLAAAGRWSLGTFAAARLLRLWIVLVPCLVLGALLDRIGLGLIAPGQAYGIPAIGHLQPAPALGPEVWLGNLLFLQTILVPVFGSNGPLWSLADEAWFYVVAALAFAAWQARCHPLRAALPAGAALLLLLILPRSIVVLAPVWGCGAALAVIRQHTPPLSLKWQRWMLSFGLLLIVIILPLERLHHGADAAALDLLLGLAITILLAAQPSLRRKSGKPLPGPAALHRCAEASYSLYLSHVPVLSLFAALVVGPERLPFGPEAVLLLSAALILSGLTGAVIWWGFERHTDRLRAWVAERGRKTRLGPSPLAEPSA